MKPRKPKWKKLEKSCGAVLFRRGEKTRFLVLKYLPGHWGFARGHARRGESERETALREIKEETGIDDIRFLKGFHEKVRFSFRKNGKNVQKQVVFFLGEVPKRAVRLSSEHLGYLWLTYTEAMNRLTYRGAKRVLKKARSFLEMSQGKIRKTRTHRLHFGTARSLYSMSQSSRRELEPQEPMGKTGRHEQCFPHR